MFKFVAEVLIALVAVWVVFSIFVSMQSGYSTLVMCRIYRVIQVIPLPQNLKYIPKECFMNPTMDTAVIEQTDASKVAEELAYNYLWKCWKDKTDEGKYGVTFDCYEILIKNVNGTITEEDITNLLKIKGYCSSLPNNFLDKEKKDFDCGNLNKIYWSGNDLQGKEVTVVMRYEALHHRVEVTVAS